MNTNKYEFDNLFRIVDSKFSNDPLSAVGSILNDPGGRFNIGDLDPLQYPRFGALYLAEDFGTAYKEKYGQTSAGSGLSIDELKMCKGHLTVQVSGKLNSVIDITEAESLTEFFSHLKHIEMPLSFITRAFELKINSMRQVRSPKELLKTLLTENWREMPMLFDVPSNSQIFGQLAYTAGVEGILYLSVKTHKKCLSIFPNNIKENSYVELTSEYPSTVLNNRIDTASYKNFII